MKRKSCKDAMSMIAKAEAEARHAAELRKRARESLRASEAENERHAVALSERGFGPEQIAAATGIREDIARALTGAG